MILQQITLQLALLLTQSYTPIVEKLRLRNFFKGMFETALKSGEIIEAIEFEIPKKSSYQKYPNPASRYAIVGVYVAECKSGVNVAITGAKSCVYNDKNLSSTLSKIFLLQL